MDDDAPLPIPLKMFCAGCGADRTVPPSAADPGPCPACGSTVRTSCRPVLPGSLVNPGSWVFVGAPGGPAFLNGWANGSAA